MMPSFFSVTEASRKTSALDLCSVCCDQGMDIIRFQRLGGPLDLFVACQFRKFRVGYQRGFYDHDEF